MAVHGEKIKELVETLMRPVVEQEPFELVDVEYVKEGPNWVLRVLVDKEGGIDVEECGRISEYLSRKLDEEDPIPNAYILEVSSPGAERPLRKPEDYRRAVGKAVRIVTREPIDGKKEFEGILESYDGEIAVVVSHGRKKNRVAVQVAQIADARLAILF